MIKTLKGKILTGIMLVVIFIYLLINWMIGNVFENNLEKYILSDLDKIKSIVYTEIKQAVGENEKEKNARTIAAFARLSRNDKAYVGLEGEEGTTELFVGRILDQEVKESVLRQTHKISSIVQIDTKKPSFYATYSYPVYIEGHYEGTLILQKDYSEEYLKNQKTIGQIRIIEAICYLFMLVLLYLMLNKSTSRLKKLTQGICKMGEGDFNQVIPIEGQDEIAQLTGHFNEMQVKIAEQIETIYEEKQRIEKLEKETKDFFNYATHEMKTPLTAIKGYGQLFRDNDIDQETLKKMANRIVLEADRMNNLVSNMLIVARGKQKNREKPERVNLKRLIQKIAKDYEVILKKKNKKLCLDLLDYEVWAVKEELRIILVNLIDNAIKYGVGEDIFIISCKERSYEIIISNEIKPLPQEIKERLLEPFVKYNYDNHTQVSSGLGLFICKELMEKNKGSLSYELKGTSLYFSVKCGR